MSENDKVATNGLGRRNFLKLAGYSAVGGAAVLALPKALAAKETSSKFVIDQNLPDKQFWQAQCLVGLWRSTIHI